MKRALVLNVKASSLALPLKKTVERDWTFGTSIVDQGMVSYLLRFAATLIIVVIGLAAYSSARAETLRVGLSELPAAYGNPYTAIGLPGTLVWLQLFDGLTKIDASGKLAPALAEDWEMIDPTTWLYRLRDDVSYADGTTFDANKAEAVFDWLLSEAGRSTIVGSAISSISEVKAQSPRELIIRTHNPDPILPNRLTIVMMVEPGAWLDLGDKAFAQNPVGTGSYVIGQWRNSNGAAELQANDQSWRAPKVRTIELLPLTDHAARFQAAISKQLHVAIALKPDEFDALRRRGFRIVVDPTKQIIGLAFDVEGKKTGPLANMRVRQALNYAVDKAAISKVISKDTWPPAGQGAAPGVFGFNPEVKAYPYDPELAKQLLEEAGYATGFKMTATVVIGTYANDAEIYQKVQQDLAAIGVKLTLRATVFSDWIQQYVSGNWRTDAFSLAWNTTPYGDAIRPMEYFSCIKPNPFFCDQSMLPLIKRANIELDRAQRELQLFELQRQFHDKAPQLFLLEYGHIWAVSEKLSGFALHDRVPQFHDVMFGKVN